MKPRKINFITVLAAAVFLFLLVSPFIMSVFRLSLIAKFMCFAIIALGLDMIWGYTGILSLGHGVYFGLGAYCMAMYLKLSAAGAGKLPDFMVWSGIKKLPALWQPFANPVFAMAAVIAVPVLLAVIIGYLTFLNRIKGVYFSILSQALSMIFSVLLIGQQKITGGSNGLTGFTYLFGLDLNDTMTKIILFYVTLAFLFVIYLAFRFLINSRFGKVLVAIRDGENRVRFTGYNPAKYKVFVYALSAAAAGIAGALFVTQVGIISPAEVGTVFSVEMIIWVAIGGKGSLIGPVIGALAVGGLKTGISENFPEIWSYFIGIVFVAVILWLPKGMISFREIPDKIRKRFGKKQETRHLNAKEELS
ncbi:urea ABC transporter permease subunit UrtC [Anaerostipes sp.]|uniref:urea ABC transporter permease subunit UrtC n=1 Tax=Anaerostipes sp. TaxID=1872530 RepID=UPI0025BE1A7E|nr:urea ABC transporter permease subunit UrtC [Anaerostipes sp.]MBS7007310.1 urea ABC transporter permease subunit UrtC [Anaerostipes sp.]